MKLLFLGDLFYDYDYVADDFDEICHYIHDNNFFTIVNLESSIGCYGSPIKKGGPNLSSSETVISLLKKMNVVVVCLSNNHTMDFGKEGLQHTLKLLDEAGIKHVGAGKNLNDAIQPAILRDEKVTIAIFNYGWNVEETVYANIKSSGCSPRKDHIILKQISDYRRNNKNHIIIPIMHWGFEYNLLPMPMDIELAHKCVDCGADLIVGHHPHVIQPQEHYKSKVIYYSLGNFYFSSRRGTFDFTFPVKEFPNRCDYGLGVAFDIEKQFIEEIGIIYDQNKKKSSLSKISFLSDLSKYQWESNEYKAQAKSLSMNWNPILGTKNINNGMLIFEVKIKHFLGRSISFLKKTEKGNRLYLFIKHVATR